MLFHHVGVACRDIEKTATKLIPMLGAIRGETVFDPNQNAHLCMLSLKDGSRVELVSGDIVSTYLKNRVSYYHVCYEVHSIEETIIEMKAAGAIVISPPKPAVLFEGRLVAFLMTPMGLVELLDGLNQ